eukprot:366304-Chlamydomonas_euryale.AAC.6
MAGQPFHTAHVTRLHTRMHGAMPRRLQCPTAGRPLQHPEMAWSARARTCSRPPPAVRRPLHAGLPSLGVRDGEGDTLHARQQLTAIAVRSAAAGQNMPPALCADARQQGPAQAALGPSALREVGGQTQGGGKARVAFEFMRRRDRDRWMGPIPETGGAKRSRTPFAWQCAKIIALSV